METDRRADYVAGLEADVRRLRRELDDLWSGQHPTHRLAERCGCGHLGECHDDGAYCLHCGCQNVRYDREPQPSDGPDYHADHQAWKERNNA